MSEKTPEVEIEVTPEMIEAGIEALRAEPLVDCAYGQAWNLAEDVIRRALAARATRPQYVSWPVKSVAWQKK